MIKDRTVATSYMIEAVRLYDHYRFRTVQEDAKGKGLKVLELSSADQAVREALVAEGLGRSGSNAGPELFA